MPPAASIDSSKVDRIPIKPILSPAMIQQQPSMLMPAPSESFAKDAIIAWFRGEFAAANAIIDELCGHLRQLDGGDAYKSTFAAIHRRRLNWIPILQMQKYYSIADVAMELKKVAEEKKSDVAVKEKEEEDEQRRRNVESSLESSENGGGDVVDEDESPESEVTDTGSQEVQHFPEHVDICSNHDECEARRAQIKMTKGFVAKEPVKGHMVNVVRGLKLYDDIFSDVELSKLNDFVNELRVAGQNGELSGGSP